ncbi:MAG: hypothetical protein SGI88_18065 [Candidatus Hydrogenedentes bacterium]|nr:hypothetical protein [Candidatus Hydrogenedentota bacterium]
MKVTIRIILGVALAVTANAPAFAGAHGPAQGSKEVPLFDDLGDHHHAITTASPKAQAYFDQGLRLIYAFNHEEANLAFREALKHDPDCAMAYWGIAAAKGPNYNLPMDEAQAKASHEASRKALELAPRVSVPEGDYIAAMALRYSDDPKADRAALDRAYADAMRALAQKYPKDDDALTLFAESLMNLRPWQLWNKDGTPAPETLDILAALETVLERNAKHAGAIHYYIHSTEASPYPEKAEPYADRLGKLMPGAGHLVHMAAHTYIRTGRYEDGVRVNIRAADVDRDYIAFRNPQGPYSMMYYPHNIHFIWSCAAIGGGSRRAISASRDLIDEAPISAIAAMPTMEFVVPTPYFALVRFGKWEKMLEEPRPPLELQYTTAMWHYARGMSFAGLDQLEPAKAEAEQLYKIRDAYPADQYIGINFGKSIITVASSVLGAEVARKEGKLDEAIKGFTEAVAVEDTFTYEEPPAWYQPVRLLLGAALLDANRPVDAEAVYREDLKHYPKNGWALFGLHQSLQEQGKKKEARAIKKQFRSAWKRADVKLASSRF